MKYVGLFLRDSLKVTVSTECCGQSTNWSGSQKLIIQFCFIYTVFQFASSLHSRCWYWPLKPCVLEATYFKHCLKHRAGGRLLSTLGILTTSAPQTNLGKKGQQPRKAFFLLLPRPLHCQMNKWGGFSVVHPTTKRPRWGKKSRHCLVCSLYETTHQPNSAFILLVWPQHLTHAF